MAFTPINANPDFGTNLDDWTESGATITRIDISGDPPPGSNGWAMHVEPDGVAEFPGAETEFIATTPGTYYWAQGTIRSAESRLIGIDVNWFDGAQDYVTTTSLGIDAEAGIWHVDQGNRHVAPEGTAFARAKISVPNTPDATETVDVDRLGFGFDPTSEEVTVGITASASVEGVGPRDADTTAEADATATGTKTGEGEPSAVIVTTSEISGTKDTSGTATSDVSAQAGAEGAKGGVGAPSSPAAIVASASATGRVQGEDVVFSDFPPLRWRVRVYAPDGVLRGQLPVPLGWQAALPLNDLSSMTLEYANSAPGHDLLDAPCEVALELTDENDMFQEYPNCRFINIRQSQDLIQSDVTTRLTMPSYGWMLRKVRNIDTQTFNEEGNRVFTDVTVGALINTFINEAHARGNVPFLVTDFNSSNDSDGQPWTEQISIEVPAGQDLWSLLQTMAAQGQCDFRMNKRTLQLYKADTFLDRDQTQNPNAKVLHTFRDVSAAPDDRSYEDIAHTILMQGDNAVFATLEQDTNPSPWGEWENFMTQSGVTEEAVLESLGTRALEMANAPRTQMTRELVFRSGSPLPVVDYRPGDHVLGQDETMEMDDLRVRQITLTMDSEALTGNVVLGDKFIERDIRIQRQIASLNNSASTIGGSGSTPNTPSEPVEDTSVPAQVTGVVLTADSYVDNLGRPRGLFSVGWDAVTQDTGGNPQEIESYRVRWSVQGAENWKQRTVGGDTTETWIGEDVVVLATYVVQVRAVGVNGIQGALSAQHLIFIPADDDAPPVPSDPVVTSRLGTLRVHWDGRDEDGLNMPIDLARVEVEMGNTGSGPFSLVGTVTGLSDLIIADQPYNTDRFFRFRAVDTSGNTSGYSGIVSGSTEPLVDTDIIGEVIDGANIIDGTIVASDKVVANTITGGLIQALAITAGKIAANAITSDKIEAGAVTAEKVQAYSLDATRIAVGGGRNLVVDPNARDDDLGTIRVNNGNSSFNSGTGIVWSHENNEFYRVTLDGSYSSMFGRIGWHAASAIDPNLFDGSGTVDPGFVYPVDRQIGGLIGRYSVNVSLTGGAWPAGAEVHIITYVRWVRKDGTYTNLSFLVSTVSYTDVSGGWEQHNSNSPVAVPDDAVGVIPYHRVEFVDGTDAIQVDLTSTFVGQANGGVLIEDGAITAGKIAANSITAAKIAANAITTDALSANAITAKHTITGSVIRTDTSGMRVVISPNANYLGQAGVRLYSGQPGARDTNIFTAGTTEGGWDLASFVIVGPEVTRNDSGRADLNFRVGGGWYVGKQWVSDSRFTRVSSPTIGNEVLIAGSVPRGNEIGDAFGYFRGLTTSDSSGTGSITWGFDNGWIYRGAIGPNTTSSTPQYSAIQASTTSSLSYNSSGTVDGVYMLVWRGGFLLP